jgi:hypothetical protein
MVSFSAISYAVGCILAPLRGFQIAAHYHFKYQMRVSLAARFHFKQ